MAIHDRVLRLALAAALCAASGCSLRSRFQSGADASRVDSGLGDAGPCSADAGGPGAFPRCSGDDLLDCVGGDVMALSCAPFGCNEMFGAHCNECTPGEARCLPGGDLAQCNALGEAEPAPCLAMACTEDPDVCAPCMDTMPICFGGKILSCTAGVQAIEDDCALGYGCTSAPAPTCNQCPPGETYCSVTGDVVQCNADGTPGAFIEVCANGCTSEPVAECIE